MAASGSRPEPQRLARLKRRRDFLAAARARKSAAPGFVLQARRRGEGEASETEGARMGFTASKKVGGAVLRNRAKRRLRALSDAVAPSKARPGWDYVLIARADATASRDFARMRVELEEAFDRVHSDQRPRSGGGRGKRGHGSSGATTGAAS